MSKGKILKITFEFEGAKESLSGEDAVEWLDKVNSMCVNLDNRGMNPFNNFDYSKWKKEI